jgi:hypothetical protein
VIVLRSSEHFLKRCSLCTQMSHVFTSPHPRRASNLSRNPSSSHTAAAMEDVQEFQESTTIKFEWTLKGLKQLFESRYDHFQISFHPAIRALLLVLLRLQLIRSIPLTQSGEGKVKGHQERKVRGRQVAGPLLCKLRCDRNSRFRS